MSNKIKAIIFDLDNVLYDEKSYIFKGFEAVAALLAKKSNFKRKKIYSQLIKDFKQKSSMYPRLFNDLLENYFGKRDKKLLKEVLEVYAEVKPRINLYAGVEDTLIKLRQKYKLGLLTNGRIEIQKNKVKLLKVAPYFDVIVYARELGVKLEKPSTLPYKKLLKILNVKLGQAIAVEDNPYTDFIGPKKLGMTSVKVLTGEFKNIRLAKRYRPDFIFKSLSDILKIL